MHILVNNIKRLTFLAVALAVGITACSNGNNNGGAGGTLANPEPPTTSEWVMVWSDEFEGSTLDLATWDIQLGDGSAEGVPGWGNNELQYYTADNLTLENGNLVITARTGDSPDANFDFTSGRIRSKDGFTFGRIEASIQMPPGQGLWGAFWMLGVTPSPYGIWGAVGEIDIFESFGQAEVLAKGTIHFGMQFPLVESVSGNASIPDPASDTRELIDPTDGFHQYAVEWDVAQIRWFVDGVNFYTVKADTYWNYYYTDDNGFVEGGSAAPFDRPQQILLNMAVGGNAAGTPDASDTDVFPGAMLVEYVRVYECPLDPQNTGLGCAGTIDDVDPFIIEVGGTGTAPAQDVALASYDLYVDAPGVLFEDSISERNLTLGVFDNSGALVVTEVAASDTARGTVIDLLTTGGGNIGLFDIVEEGTFTLSGMGDPNDEGTYGGELRFDIYVFSGADTDASSALRVKMDSGFPDIGFVEIPLADLPTDQWVTVSRRISDVIKGGIGSEGGDPLDMEAIVNLIVLEPTGAAHLQVDNIQLRCGAPESRPCGIVPVATIPQNVFIDEVDAVWDLGIVAFDDGVGSDYNDGTNLGGTNKVEWQVIADEDLMRGNVIEVLFNDSAARGLLFIQSSVGVNLQGYDDGEVAFDLIVTDYGNNTDGISIKVDCGAACSSGEQDLGVVADGVWETIRVPVQQLINLGVGLDTAAVSIGIGILPNTQTGEITFRLDNIRWEPTTDIVTGPRPPIAFSSDFESLNAGASLIGDDWQVFASLFDGANFLDSYGPFEAPNNTGGFSNVATGEGGGDPEFGDQHLEAFSDYNNTAAHSAGEIVEASILQEFEITEDDTGLYLLTFDVKAPTMGGIAAPSTAVAFIKTLETETGTFGTTSTIEEDLSAVDSSGWTSVSMELVVDAATQAGELLQFGFTNRATNNDASALLFDNVVFEDISGFSYSQDFEALNINSSFALGVAGERFTVFATVFTDASMSAVAYNYSASAPNGGPGFSAIATGEGDEDQGSQYLNIYSDYNNMDHDPVTGRVLETSVFQEFTIDVVDLGTYTFTFDAKAPLMGGINAAVGVTTMAFIKTLDPSNGFITTNNIELDMTNVSNTDWATFTFELAVTDPALVGQLLQFGWTTVAFGYEDSGVYYDNISFTRNED